MAITLQNPENIATGWPGPPQLHAPEIGGLVGHILQNRILQRAQQDKEIADAIKQYQEQRNNQAVLQGLQNTGVLPQGDYGNMDARSALAAAQLYQGTIPDRQRDALLAAQTKEALAKAGLYDANANAGDGSDGGGGPEVIEKDGIKYLVHRTSKSVTYSRLPGQYGPTRTEQENAAPTMDQQTVYPDEPSPNPTPSPNPDVTITPTPPPTTSPTPSDQAGGHAQNYGVPVPAEIAPSRDKAVAGQTYYAPDRSIRVRGNN